MSRKCIEYIRAGNSAPELILCRETARDYPWHFHARHWTFGLVRAGSITVTTLQGAFTLGPGDTFAIPPLAPHKLGIASQSSLAVLCMTDPCAAAVPHTHALAEQDGDTDLTAWLADPLAHSALTVQGPTVTDVSPVAAARQLITSRPDEHFPLAALATLAGYSPWSFLRAFKRHTGLTPHAFQLICRVSRARALLRTGTAPAEAAVSSGFSDQSHLHKAFKRHHGLTPRQFLQAGTTQKC